MSQTLRVFLPATFTALGQLRDRGELVVDEAYAVTPALREQLGEQDEEELSYAALQLAAAASLRLLATDPGAPRRRVVIAADVPADPLGAGAAGDGGRVRLSGPVPRSAVAAVHVDNPVAEPEVAAVAGEDDGGVEYELEWFDASELDQLAG
ncbi:MAG: DUF6912 family protein [Natronosporangium sp.]